MTTEPDSFGRRLAWARGSAGMSQHELAKLVDVRENDIGRWEKGKNRPRDLSVIVKLALATGRTTDFLLGANGGDDAPGGLAPTPPEDPQPRDSDTRPRQSKPRGRRRGR